MDVMQGRPLPPEGRRPPHHPYGIRPARHRRAPKKGPRRADSRDGAERAGYYRRTACRRCARRIAQMYGECVQWLIWTQAACVITLWFVGAVFLTFTSLLIRAIRVRYRCAGLSQAIAKILKALDLTPVDLPHLRSQNRLQAGCRSDFRDMGPSGLFVPRRANPDGDDAGPWGGCLRLLTRPKRARRVIYFGRIYHGI